MKYSRTLMKAIASVVAFALLLTGCDSMTADEPGTAPVTLQFATQASDSQNATMTGKASTADDDVLRVSGNNGVLEITDIRFIVESFELEKADGECEGLEDEEEELCEEFEAAPSFVDLPLEGGIVAVASDQIDAGLYEELEFEVGDLDFDEEGEDDEADRQALVNEIRDAYPQWPAEASMVIVGTFTPSGGVARPFTVFAEAEIEVEMEFDTPVEVTEAGANQDLIVNVAPELWFARAGGDVLNLSERDFAETGSLLEFELEIEDGFTSIEHEDEDDDDEQEEEPDDDE